MTLNAQGVLAAVTIAMYVPFLFISIKLVAKYGISRGDGWILLLIFSIIRVLGGSLLVAAEEVMPVNTSLYIGGYTLEASGLFPLLLCTSGLLHSVFQTPDGFMRYNTQFRLFHIFGMVAPVLTIIGVTSSGSSANTMRRAGVILFCVLYIILVGVCLYLWSQIRFVMRYRKQLLKVISISLLFLVIRTIYSVLSTFSSSTSVITTTTTTQPTGDLAKFNMFTGEWQIYLVMDMLMEYAIVIIYAVAGLVLPLDQDYKSPAPDSYQDEYLLSRP
ncbi:hypothetical protein EDB19DRAFT_82210 [Suillus lakei]|nr:hypothetical protein EDB19DRAFT_82210 [Suillus lakei]